MLLKELSFKIETILAASQSARDSDLALIYMLCNRYYNISESDSFHDVLVRIDRGYIPTFESITRCRRKLQENGKYPSSPEVAKKRRQEESSIKGQIKMWR